MLSPSYRPAQTVAVQRDANYRRVGLLSLVVLFAAG